MGVISILHTKTQIVANENLLAVHKIEMPETRRFRAGLDKATSKGQSKDRPDTVMAEGG